MRILRLRLRNYRGISEREVHFAPNGITVVAGPNEIGKSSLAEAIDLIFDERDSTTKQRVRDVQPVDRDEGAEIEVEVETGPYAFVCWKRFQRRPATKLSVTRPSRENHTGRAAHERMRAILEETLDAQLWRALRVQQGQGLEQASWLGQPALAAAIDRAAGSVPADGASEESLFEAATTERGRYFTPTGRERRELSAATRDAEKALHLAESHEEALANLEDDVRRAAELRERIGRLEAEDGRAETTLREREQSFRTVATLRDALRTIEARRDAARAEEREALRAARQRGQLVAAHAAAEADLAQRSEEIEGGEPALLAARAELEHADRAATAAREALDAVSRRDAQRHAELELRRAEDDLAQLRERMRRIAAAEREVAAAHADAHRSSLSEAEVQEVRKAELAVERAQARVESEGPLVQLTARRPLEASLDGRTERIESGQTLERQITESLLLSVPEALDLTVVAGADAAARLKVLEEARTRWRTRCAELDVADHADAVATLSALREAQRRLGESERARDDLRQGQNDAALRTKLTRMEARVAELAARRDPQLILPSESESAEGPIAETTADLEKARRTRDEAERLRETISRRHRDLAEHHHDTAVRLDLAERSFADLDARLGRAREEQSDEALELARETRDGRARTLDAEALETAKRLASCDPDRAEADLAAARTHREECSRELTGARDEALQVAARLEVRGEAGLFEQTETARAEALRLARSRDALVRRARAAATLYEALEQEREQDRHGYAAPLKARIEALGRGVFGEDFEVELDEELRVARRIQGGVGLAFDQLSAGAREQIALLSRLACATLVGDEDGAPLILDDALGHSDPARLALLGHALAEAAPACQILVLTCTPERYRSVDSAHVVQLG
jgi:chromosome segregation ATPase